MGSLGVCVSTSYSLQTRRLCLNNSFGTYVAVGKIIMSRRSSTRSNLSLLNAHVHTQSRRLSTALTSPTNDVRLSRTGKETRFSEKVHVGLRQYAATITTTSSLNSDTSQDPRKEPDDRPALDDAVSHVKEKQVKTPWEREGSQTPPVKRERSASAMTKGMLGLSG
jgi:hypothetical protein